MEMASRPLLFNLFPPINHLQTESQNPSKNRARCFISMLTNLNQEKEKAVQTSSSDSLHKLVHFISIAAEKDHLPKLSDYRPVQFKDLEEYISINGPITTKSFGLVSHFELGADSTVYPQGMVVSSKEEVVAKINAKLDHWIESHTSIGGRNTSSQGAFILNCPTGKTEIRMPDVAYTPRADYRSLTESQLNSYKGEPFSPSFVVEVDTLVGEGSQRSQLYDKLKNHYFAHGNKVRLAWLIDPLNKIMIVFYVGHNNKVIKEVREDWRDLEGKDVLPGFKIRCKTLDRCLSQDAGSSDDDFPGNKGDFACRFNCGARFGTVAEIAYHELEHVEEGRNNKMFK